MKTSLSLAAFIFSLAVSPSLGQAPIPRATPTPHPLPNFQQIIQDARNSAVHPGEKGGRRARRDSAEAWRQVKREMEPEEAVEKQFEGMLDDLDAEMVRLHPDFGCEAKLTLSVEAECSGRVIGASRFAGLHYNKGDLIGDAFFTLFILAEVGDADLRGIDSTHSSVRLVTSVALPTDLGATRALYRRLEGSGIDQGDLRLSDRVEVVEGKIFIVRVVSYRATGINMMLRPDQSLPPFMFMGLGRPERRDVTYAAKIVKRAEDGVIHLVWRQIARKSSPKIRFGKDEVPQDFRTKKGK